MKMQLEKLAELEAACRQAGMPVTHQRRKILEALAATTDHPTADQIFASVKTELPNMSRTTVYRVLEALAALGVAKRVSSPGSAARYDARTDAHHHAVCQSCERIVDIEPSEALEFPMPRKALKGFELREYSIQFLGLCPDCREASKTAST